MQRTSGTWCAMAGVPMPPRPVTRETSLVTA